MSALTPAHVIPKPEFFDRYIDICGPADIISQLETSAHELLALQPKLEQFANHAYAPGKWTVKEVVQHITDNERIQAYRALRIARGDQTPLPGYDEELLAAGAQASRQSITFLLQEFEAVRRSSILLFQGCTNEMLLQTGNSNQIVISPLALGFVLVGHLHHHVRILHERYFN